MRGCYIGGGGWLGDEGVLYWRRWVVRCEGCYIGGGGWLGDEGVLYSLVLVFSRKP